MIKSKIIELLENPTNLDIMTSFSEGKSRREIVDETGKKLSSVDFVIKSLRDYKLIEFGRWNVDVQALGMTKTLEFRGFTEDNWNRIFEKNFFLSYLSRIKIGKTKYLAMYTFPKEIREKIGSEISSWYYSYPHFETPFFRQDFTEEEFLERFKEENNDNPLPPRGKKIKNPDLIDFLISRYVQLEKDEIKMEKCTKKINETVGNDIDVSKDEVEKHFDELKNKNVIYPVVPLDFSKILYGRIYCIISLEEIFRLMKTLNKFNMITAISFMKEKKAVLLTQCPYEFQNTITNIFDQLDRENEIYVVTKVYENRGLPYKYYLKNRYYLEKFSKPQKDKAGR